jgi:hypothetical protein
MVGMVYMKIKTITEQEIFEDINEIKNLKLGYSDVTFTHEVNQKQHLKKHRLMLLDHEDVDHKVNPIDYKFPENDFKKLSYYRDCSEIYYKNSEVGEIDFLDDIIFLDFKVSHKAKTDNTFKFIEKFFNNYQKTKLLHYVNFFMPLIPSETFDNFCKYFNSKKIKKGCFLEIFNIALWKNENIDNCLNDLIKINFSNFIGIEYHHIYDDKNAVCVPLKNKKNQNIGRMIPYNPNANRENV